MMRATYILTLFAALACIGAGKPLSISLSPVSATITEGRGATFLLSKSGGNGRLTSVKITTSDGSYSASVVPGTSFTVPTVDDTGVNGTRKITVTAVASTGAKATATITELDNDVAPTPAPSTGNPMVGQALGVGAPDIPTTDHDISNDLTPSWGNGAIAKSNAPDNVGAFRFVCRHTNLGYIDPTVFPGQPGASHLHDQTGVNGWNASSNYGNLRIGGGGSGCNQVAEYDQTPAQSSWSANRTPYWQPALLDGKGNVILADYTSFYYKRRPLTDPVVSDPTNPQYEGKAAPLPNGIKFIFGADVANGTVTNFRYQCTDGPPGIAYEESVSFAEAINCARSHPDGTLEVIQSGPECWDGVHLDSPDHRSHLVYASFGDWGYEKCDAAHPYVIPTFTYAAFYTILASDDGDIHFSSDEMDNTKPRGWSFHVDYGPAAWDPGVKKMWENNCIEKLLSCSGGDLGNGLQLKGAAVPYYPTGQGGYATGWRNPVRLVPMPPRSVITPPW